MTQQPVSMVTDDEVLAPLGAGPPVLPCRPGPSSAWSLVDGGELDEGGEDEGRRGMR